MIKIGQDKKVRIDKKIRVNPSLDQETHKKLKRLAIACDMPKTRMAEEMIKICVSNPSVINYIQDMFKADDRFRVTPITANGEVYFD